MTTSLSSARDTIIDAVPEYTSLHGRPPELRSLYLPGPHAKALQPDAMLVAGGRGCGKSFWWAALQEPAHRELVQQLAPRTGIDRETVVTVGFGEISNPDAYPGRDTLTQLLGTYEARVIWRTVVVFHLAPAGHPAKGGGSWAERVGYVASHPEEVERLLADRDRDFERRGVTWLILFDALDRSASTWEQMYTLIRGLLQTLLDLRPYRRLRAKCFLRTDQLVEREVANFPDASKVLASKVDLEWPVVELYNILWQYLGNAADGRFRDETGRTLELAWRQSSLTQEVVWLVPERLRRDAALQKLVFERITGPWMGRDHRRGYPYTWVPSHLADAAGQVSPRSFLAAMLAAARDSLDKRPEDAWPIPYESLKRGVQQASQIRVTEVAEDYPWVNTLMDPLRGRVVPCAFEELSAVWNNAHTLEALADRAAKGRERLPPARLEPEGAVGVRKDLEELGIFERTPDGRVNIPDVYRVGYGLGRRGGVKPMPRSGGGGAADSGRDG